jgi:antitoxin VapB
MQIGIYTDTEEMPLYIRDESVDALAERVKIAMKSTSKTEAVRTALRHELERLDQATPLRVRIKRLQESLGINGRTEGFDQKAFSDSLYED